MLINKRYALNSMEKYVDTFLKLRGWASIGHHIPGRVRLKYKLGIVAHLAKFNKGNIEQLIQEQPAFRNYKLNTATGSLVIEYDPKLVPPNLIDLIFCGSDQDAEQACYAIADCLA